MKHRLPKAALLTLLLLLPTTSGCATILGTAVSPITGGVDLAMKYSQKWYTTPAYFLAGVVAGPFKAFYNGVNYDAAIFKSFTAYWRNFDSMFRPFRLTP
jgi:hypothetical protein